MGATVGVAGYCLLETEIGVVVAKEQDSVEILNVEGAT